MKNPKRKKAKVTKMTKRHKLQSIFSNWITSGIFNALDSFDVPWKDDNISSTLDIEYFGNISGNKTVSPLVEKLLSIDDSDTL